MSQNNFTSPGYSGKDDRAGELIPGARRYAKVGVFLAILALLACHEPTKPTLKLSIGCDTLSVHSDPRGYSAIVMQCGVSP